MPALFLCALEPSEGEQAMSERAKRLGKFLERRDWTVFEANEECWKCGKRTSFADKAKFCMHCGSVLKHDQHEKEVLKDLEAAIKYALKKP